MEKERERLGTIEQMTGKRRKKNKTERHRGEKKKEWRVREKPGNNYILSVFSSS